MSYIEENLITGENILYRTGLHWIVLLRSGIAGGFFVLLGILILISGGSAILGLLSAAVGCLIFILAIVNRNATEMAVTNKRVIVKVGLFKRKTIEVFLPKIESVGVEQGLLERMVDCGSINVRGTGGTYEPFRKVRSPLEFRRQVQQHSEGLTTT